MAALALLVELLAFGVTPADALGATVGKMAKMLIGKLPLSANALKAKTYVIGGFLSMKADVADRFNRNFELAHSNWNERSDALTQLAPREVIAFASAATADLETFDPEVVEAEAAASQRKQLRRERREERLEKEAAKKAGLSDYQMRHMMSHYKTLRPTRFLASLLASKKAREEKEEATRLAESESDSLGEVGGENHVLGTTHTEEVDLQKRRARIHESRRFRKHRKEHHLFSH